MTAAVVGEEGFPAKALFQPRYASSSPVVASVSVVLRSAV
jgi:hypothetical protein